jgi:hypothetical protein
MSCRTFALSSVAVMLLMLAGCHTSAENRASAAADMPSGTVKLFNGKDLTGWEAEGGAKWVVENGLLIGTQGQNNAPGDLFTKASYDDFLATVTWRVEWPCNSGVWFRYQSPEKAYQADILEYTNPECYAGTLYCPGKMFLAMNTDKTLVNREGWNTIKIRCEGDRSQIWLNGRQVADVHDDTSASGRIGFQVHPGKEFGPMKIIVRDVLVKGL